MVASDVLRQVFETVVRRCMAEGLVGGEAFAVDASMIRADAHRQHGVASRADLDLVETSRAVSEFNDAGGPTWTSIASCSVSSRTSRRCTPVPRAASWTKPARG